ncbi:MAG TPA: mechanosensitive ion channel family protein [Clostridiaceae bacterium]|nr:mechanosensitive ion channel family protein [Clostridiaceae bacterium]
MLEYTSNFLIELGIDSTTAKILAAGFFLVLTILLCIMVDFFVQRFLIKVIAKYIKGNKIKWDNYLLDRKVFEKLSLIVPAIIINLFASAFGVLQKFVEKVSMSFIYVVLIFTICSLLDVANDIYNTYPISKSRPIKGIIQVVKIAVYILIGAVVISTLIDKDPLILLSGIGALTAVTSLVFKDSILGLVAGFQLAGNNLLKIGDWIEMPKYGADGYVIDISLNTIKVQNFDKTIVSIPSYALISDSFKNWRGMQESGGRRIKRAIYIDTSSIKFCTREMLEKFKKIQYITEYIHYKEREIEEYNKINNVNEEILVNGRHLTNIGTFRAYIEFYLKNHPKIHKGLIHMVRQLPPCEHGLPLEIYAFVNDTNWVNYEGVQADIFDHVLAVAGEFDLRIFQSPTGHDIHKIGARLNP